MATHARSAARRPARARKSAGKRKRAPPSRRRKTTGRTWKKGTRGARAEARVAAEYRRKGWRVEPSDGRGSDFKMYGKGRPHPLHVEVKTSAGKLEPHQRATRRRVGRANYRVEWRATRRQRTTRKPGRNERNRDARAARMRGGTVIRRSRGSLTWQ